MPMAVAPFAFSSRQTRWPHGANRTVLSSTGEMSCIRRWRMKSRSVSPETYCKEARSGGGSRSVTDVVFTATWRGVFD